MLTAARKLLHAWSGPAAEVLHLSDEDFRRARWYVIRPAANLKPATYRCPLCGDRLAALSEHMLITPEGDSRRRRHAHSACVMKARKAGRLPFRDEVEPPRPGFLSRLLGRRERTR